jgi:mercuric ion binding protein
MLVAAAVGSGGQSKVVLDIQNMTCSLCVISVNQALRETDGVIKAKSS